MSSSYGENIRLTIFGQSHSAAIGMTLEGVPAGETIDEEKLNRFLEREETIIQRREKKQTRRSSFAAS